MLRGMRAECHVSNNTGVSTSVPVAMGHDQVLEWIMTQPPTSLSSVAFFAVRIVPYLTQYKRLLPVFAVG